jgi:hypothetical protein
MCGRHDTTISLAYLFEKEMSQKEINDWDVPLSFLTFQNITILFNHNMKDNLI